MVLSHQDDSAIRTSTIVLEYLSNTIPGIMHKTVKKVMVWGLLLSYHAMLTHHFRISPNGVLTKLFS